MNNANKQDKEKWKQWFENLKVGDRVHIQLPWDDRGCPGGRKVIATVGRTKFSNGKRFNYRNRNGVRQYRLLNSWQGDCYSHVMPIGYDIDYCPKRGFVMRKVDFD